MEYLIPLENYRFVAHAENERSVIFARDWQFVGLREDLAHDGDYLTAELGGRAVVIQNFAGGLRAFTNSCAHRGTRLRKGCGSAGALRCSYHGWTYDAEGVAIGIPDRSSYDFSSPPRLQRWEVDVCGELVFVKPMQGAGSLREFLGGAFDEIVKMTAGFGPTIGRFERSVNADWKLLVENVLDLSHVPIVHAESLGKLRLGNDGFQVDGLHSWSLAPFGAPTQERRAKVGALARLETRPIRISGYYHLHVFPCFFLATADGISFNLQYYRPIGAGKAHFYNRHILTRVPGSPLPAAIAEAVSEEIVAVSHRILEEDIVVCEDVQVGLADANGPGPLSRGDRRIEAFHKAYLERMRSARAG